VIKMSINSCFKIVVVCMTLCLSFFVFGFIPDTNAMGYPTLSGVSPASTYVTYGIVYTTITGTNFSTSGFAVKLSKSGVDISTMSSVIGGHTSDYCSFNIAGASIGLWDVVAFTGGSSTAMPNGFMISSMTVNSVTPVTSNNTGSVSITNISGGGFVGTPTVTLSQTGQTDITATNVALGDSSDLTCTFDLTGKAGGLWNLIVTTGAYTAILPNAFSITAVSIGNLTDPGSSSEIAINPPSGQIKVNISAGTFSQAVNVVLSTGVVPASTNPTIKVGNICLEITNSLNLQPGKPVIITVNYRDSDIAGLDVSKLALCRYDKVNNIWIPLPTTMDTVNKVITAPTDHFSTYVVVQLAPAADLASVKAYPMPYYPARGNLTVENLTSNATIKIYTITGELDKTVGYASSNGVATWDGKNNNGSIVASGVYIMYIEGPSGKQRLKIAVER